MPKPKHSQEEIPLCLTARDTATRETTLLRVTAGRSLVDVVRQHWRPAPHLYTLIRLDILLHLHILLRLDLLFRLDILLQLDVLLPSDLDGVVSAIIDVGTDFAVQQIPLVIVLVRSGQWLGSLQADGAGFADLAIGRA